MRGSAGHSGIHTLDEREYRSVRLPELRVDEAAMCSALQCQDFEAFKAKYDDFEAPILAYCRSGARSAILFQLYDAE